MKEPISTRTIDDLTSTNLVPVISEETYKEFEQEVLRITKGGDDAMRQHYIKGKSELERAQPEFFKFMYRFREIPGRSFLDYPILDKHRLISRETEKRKLIIPPISQDVFHSRVLLPLLGRRGNIIELSETEIGRNTHRVTKFIGRVNPIYFQHSVSTYGVLTGKENPTVLDNTLRIGDIFYIALNEQMKERISTLN